MRNVRSMALLARLKVKQEDSSVHKVLHSLLEWQFMPACFRKVIVCSTAIRVKTSVRCRTHLLYSLDLAFSA